MIVDKMKKREPTAKKIKNKVDIPVGKWIKCDKCQEILYKEDVKENLNICPVCGAYFRMHINRRLENIIDEYKPDAISVEELFFNNNAKTAINVAQARGVILVVGCRKQIPTYEYTPLQIKQAVVGYGRADKIQVQKMVKTILNVEKLPKLDDTTDSMAAAICHAHSAKFSQKL